MNSITNSQAASDAVSASLFQQWLLSQSTVTDGNDNQQAVGGVAGQSAAGASPELQSAIGPMADSAIAAANAAGVPLPLLGAVLGSHMNDANLLDVAQSPDQKTGPMQISQNDWKAIIPSLSAEDRKTIESLTGKTPEQLNMNDPNQNVVAGAFMLKKLLEKNQGDTNKTIESYVRDVLGLDPKSAAGAAMLDNLEAAIAILMNELNRKNAAAPKPKPAVAPSSNGVAHQTRSADSGSNAGGAQASSGSGGGGSGGAQGSSGSAEVHNYNPDFKPVGGDLNLQNEKMKQWNDGIMAASKISGIPPQIIAGQVWCESRGNPAEKSTNIDGTSDVGLMQISQDRWEHDILPNLSDETKAQIEEITGVPADQLDMNNPLHNIIGGSLELKSWLKEANGDMTRALNGYVSGNLDGHGPGDNNYAEHVLYDASLVEQGKPMPDNQ